MTWRDRRPRLLFVDDEEAILVAVHDYFSHRGFEVSCARNPVEAERHLARQTYDGVIADLRLSGSDGLEIDGNVQTDGARRVRLIRTDVGGSVQLEGLTSDLASVVDRSEIEGSIQVKQNRSPLRLLNNFVDSDVQAFSNRGGVRIELNVIGGNLQCKSNDPRPVGFGNQVGGNKEDQCRNL